MRKNKNNSKAENWKIIAQGIYRLNDTEILVLFAFKYLYIGISGILGSCIKFNKEN